MLKLSKIIILTCVGALVSCGGDQSEISAGAQNTIDAALPHFYDILRMEGKEKTVAMLGEEAHIVQFAVEVEVKEDLYRRSHDLERYVKKLTKGEIYEQREAESLVLKKQILKRVNQKGEKTTLYGELISEVKADGQLNMMDFKLDAPKAKALSAFDRTEILIDGSSEAEAYFDQLIEEKKTAQKLVAEERAAVEKMKAEEEAMKAEKMAKKIAAIQQRSEDTKAKLLKFFTKGNVYEGIYKHKQGGKVTLEVLEFDPKLFFGVIELTSLDQPTVSFPVKVTLTSAKQRDGEIQWNVTGSQSEENPESAEYSRELRLAAVSRSHNRLEIREFYFTRDLIAFRVGHQEEMFFPTEPK